MSGPTKPRPAVRKNFTLRMSDNLAAMLEDAARQNDRSMNAEIVARLRRSLEGYTR